MPLSRGWTIVLAILTVGIGLLVPLTIYFWRRGQRTSAYISAGVFGFFALLVVIAAATGGSSNSRNSANQSTPQQPSTTQQSTQTQSTQTQTHTSAPPPTEARFVLVIGKSACGEDPCVAYINCHVAVRNAGGTAGDAPDVYVLIRYSDGGQKIIDNVTDPYAQSDQPGGFTISPHTTRVIYLQQSYDATSHDLVQAASSLDLNANSYPYIACTTC